MPSWQNRIDAAVVVGSLPYGERSIPLTLWLPLADAAGESPAAAVSAPAELSPGFGRGRAWVVHVPAFAEEMNKSRHLVARQARRLAAEGMVVVVPDLLGTGDSADDFSAAGWEAWRAEMAAVVAYAHSQEAGPVILWGLRLGCILAAEVAADPALAIDALVFWSPVRQGKQQVSQLLRLHRAGALLGREEEGGAPTARDRLEAGETAEIAGYAITAGLYRELLGLKLPGLDLGSTKRIVLLSLESPGSAADRPAPDSLLEEWRAAGHECLAVPVSGPPFWSTQELAFLPALEERTTEAFIQLRENARAAGAEWEEVAGNSPEAFGPAAGGDGVATGVTLECDGARLVGRLHDGAPGAAIGVVIVVGGPQYRVGSHRLFVHLAERIATAGHPCLRFDYRGMGDSEGELRGFTEVGSDIRAAVDALVERCPSVRGVVLWGLCDAATAAVDYAAGDSRVDGLVLANPWVFTEAGAASVRVRKYYANRIVTAEFWKKLATGRVDLIRGLREFASSLGRHLSARRRLPAETAGAAADEDADLPTRFGRGLSRFAGPTLLVLSGKDYTAAEFNDCAQRDDLPLKSALRAASVESVTLAEADHTFSREAWREAVTASTVAFVGRLHAPQA